ncbi:helix-turn-helix transcriptional regulator [Desertimonas flava]|jgi:predicted DNA-binding transcriptional regulator YafY|uniref:helix-turn-helix transcriptional regulator n=1 Tax=Desertimonas flava TaxID=2064846 RepID=UPI000E34A06E|nr:WYL domain-containing protein [Desertimonas flava]
MKASRLVQLLLVLQRRGRTTAEELAAELEVSVRTVYRDVEALGMAGVPIYGARGLGGGISLAGGYETRLTGLTEPEAAALTLAGLPDAAAQLGLGSVLMAAQAKVDAALPAELRARSARLRERFHVDMPGWFRRPDDVPLLGALATAVWDGRRVDVRYRRGGGRVRRRIDPLGIVLKNGTWYLLGGVRRPDGVRTYRISRIESVVARDEAAVRPPGFDLVAAWGRAMESFERELRSYVVHVLVRTDQLGRLRHALSEPAATWAFESAAPSDEPGWSAVTVHSESPEVAADELIRLGSALRVLDPVEVGERIAAEARALVRHHG